MRNRKTVVVAFMLCAVMLLGIGYAALTDTLEITGSAGVNVDDSRKVFDEDVYFSKVISGNGCTAEILSDNDKGEITVTDGELKEVGNEVIATYTIKSESDLAVKVTPSIEVLNPTYFQVTHSWAVPSQTIPAGGGTVDITITIKLIKTADADQDTTFDVTFIAESVD